MLGYVFGFCVALLLVVACFAGGWGRTSPRPGKKVPRGKPVQPEDPSADEPTPDRSAIASSRQVAAARQHVPPA